MQMRQEVNLLAMFVDQVKCSRNIFSVFSVFGISVSCLNFDSTIAIISDTAGFQYRDQV